MNARDSISEAKPPHPESLMTDVLELAREIVEAEDEEKRRRNQSSWKAYAEIATVNGASVARALLASAEGSALTPRDERKVASVDGDTLVRRLDGRALFFDKSPLDASRSNLHKTADLFREAARRIERLTGALQTADESIRHHIRGEQITSALIQEHAVRAIREALSKDRGEARPSPSLSGRG